MDAHTAALNEVRDRAEQLRALLAHGLKISNKTGQHAAVFVALFATRTSRNLDAVITLCSGGFGIESQALLRVMSQDMVEVRYVATDPQVLPAKWCEHESRRRYYAYAKHVEKTGAPPPTDMDELKALIARDREDARRAAAERLGKEKPSAKEVRRFLLKNRWTRLNIAQAADEAEKRFEGTVAAHDWYEYLSEHAHGSAASARDYLKGRDGTFFTNPHDPAFKSAPMAIAALHYAYLVFVALADMGLDFDPASLSGPLEAALSILDSFL